MRCAWRSASRSGVKPVVPLSQPPGAFNVVAAPAVSSGPPVAITCPWPFSCKYNLLARALFPKALPQYQEGRGWLPLEENDRTWLARCIFVISTNSGDGGTLRALGTKKLCRKLCRRSMMTLNSVIESLPADTEGACKTHPESGRGGTRPSRIRELRLSLSTGGRGGTRPSRIREPRLSSSTGGRGGTRPSRIRELRLFSSMGGRGATP